MEVLLLVLLTPICPHDVKHAVLMTILTIIPLEVVVCVVINESCQHPPNNSFLHPQLFTPFLQLETPLIQLSYLELFWILPSRNTQSNNKMITVIIMTVMIFGMLSNNFCNNNSHLTFKSVWSYFHLVVFSFPIVPKMGIGNL